MDRSVQKAIEGARKADGSIDESRLGKSIEELLSSGGLGTKELLISLIVTNDEAKVRYEEMVKTTLVGKRLRGEYLAQLQSENASLHARIEVLQKNVEKFIRIASSHTADVELAARSVDLEKLGRELHSSVYRESLQKLENVGPQVRIACNRLARKFERVNERMRQAEKGYQSLKLGIFKQVCRVCAILAVTLTVGAYISASWIGGKIIESGIVMPMELQRHNARIERVGDSTILIVDNVDRVLKNRNGNAVVVLEVNEKGGARASDG